MSLNILMVSDEMIKDRTQIHGNIDPKLIYPDIKVAQDMYIHPILGTGLYDKILTLIDAGGPPAGVYKTLLDNFIIDTLMWYTLSALPITLSFQFWNKGVVRKQGVDTELPSMTELIDLQNTYKNRAEFYANRMRLYLKQNAAVSFPEYLNPGDGLDTINPENKSFTNPVFLGGECAVGRSYEEMYQGNRNGCCE